jgi:hypothetical protein
MRNKPTRRNWLRQFVGGLFGLGAAGAAEGRVPPGGQTPSEPPVPSRPLSHADTPLVLGTTCVYDFPGPVATSSSQVTTVVYDSYGSIGV